MGYQHLLSSNQHISNICNTLIMLVYCKYGYYVLEIAMLFWGLQKPINKMTILISIFCIGINSMIDRAFFDH